MSKFDKHNNTEIHEIVQNVLQLIKGTDYMPMYTQCRRFWFLLNGPESGEEQRMGVGASEAGGAVGPLGVVTQLINIKWFMRSNEGSV